jgi:hypothetical protein
VALPTVQTKANGTHGIHRKKVLPWLGHWAHRAGTRDFGPALADMLTSMVNYRPK